MYKNLQCFKVCELLNLVDSHPEFLTAFSYIKFYENVHKLLLFFELFDAKNLNMVEKINASI